MAAAISKLLRAAIARPRSLLLCAAMTTASIVVPLLLRMALDGGTFGAQFAFIYPAALAIALLCGMRWGLLSGFGGMMLTFWLLVGSHEAAPRDLGQWSVLIMVSMALLMIVFVGSLLRVTVAELNEAKEEVDSLNSELMHRSKNALQLVQALASGAKRAADPGAFYRALEGRLQALAAANQILKYGAAQSCPVEQVVTSAIRPFDSDRIKVGGTECSVEATSVVALSLALHELATNATKYGALSVAEGCVEITCTRDPAVAGSMLVTWIEREGPLVTPPVHRGMGTRLLATQKGLEVLAHDYLPTGVRCFMRLPLADDRLRQSAIRAITSRRRKAIASQR